MEKQRQSREEELANVLTHGIGVLFGVIASFILMNAAFRTTNPWIIGSLAVYSLSMTLSYITSTLYHAATNSDRKGLLRRFDHGAIYLHIAGTYTPFTLIALRTEAYWGWSLFAIVWIAAAIGVGLCFRKLKKKDHLKTFCYLAMGWVVVIAFKPLIDVFSQNNQMEVLYWLIAGGLSYTFGTIFFYFDYKRYMHSVWHLFVLGGSVCHFLAILRLTQLS